MRASQPAGAPVAASGIKGAIILIPKYSERYALTFGLPSVAIRQRPQRSFISLSAEEELPDVLVRQIRYLVPI